MSWSGLLYSSRRIKVGIQLTINIKSHPQILFNFESNFFIILSVATLRNSLILKFLINFESNFFIILSVATLKHQTSAIRPQPSPILLTIIFFVLYLVISKTFRTFAPDLAPSITKGEVFGAVNTTGVRQPDRKAMIRPIRDSGQ